MTSNPAALGNFAADPSPALDRLLTGRVVGPSAIPEAITAFVAPTPSGLPVDELVVTVPAFGTTSTLRAYFEPRWYWNGTANVPVPRPPAETPCVVVFPRNTTDPKGDAKFSQGYGWALSFIGWPTQ